MKSIGLLVLLILVIPAILLAEDLVPARMHLGLVTGSGASYIGKLGETPEWNPESFGYFAPTLTYYTPTGLAIRTEIAKLTRRSTMESDTHFYHSRKISSTAIHVPVTVLYPLSGENSVNKYYVGAGFYLDMFTKASLTAEHNSAHILKESILEEFGTVGYGVSAQLGVGLSKTFYVELRYLMDMSEFSAASITEYNLRTQSLMLRLGMDIFKHNLD